MAIRIRTGYEDLSLREIMKIWLYSEKQIEVMRATVELRRKLTAIAPREEKQDDGHSVTNPKL